MTRTLALACLVFTLGACTEPVGEERATRSYERIVTLAPNLTELVFAVGAGDKLVGVSAWSDYPAAAHDLPIVGDAFSVDHEQLALVNPDLLLVWESGTPAHFVDRLRNAGYTVETIRTRALDDIGPAMQRIGELAGRESEASKSALKFDQAIDTLRQSHAGKPAISVFYQVSAKPLYTVNGQHFVSQLIEICGGRNIFADLDDLAPTIAVEAVVDRNPEVLLASTDAGDDGFSEWQRWPSLLANRYGNLFLLPADEIARATPRVIVAGAAMCLALQQARANRARIDGA